MAASGEGEVSASARGGEGRWLCGRGKNRENIGAEKIWRREDERRTK